MDEKKLKILLVDDDSNLRELYAEIFQNQNFEVIQAVDGLEGLDKATKEVPDVIFTGIIMPRMDGFELMEALKKIVMTSNIPVVISSHMGREADQQRANELGAKDFIIRDVTKPLEVVERIKSLFAKAGGTFKLQFVTTEMDAPKLQKDLTFPPNYSCVQCGKTLAIELKNINAQERNFEAKFICPSCGWIAK